MSSFLHYLFLDLFFISLLTTCSTSSYPFFALFLTFLPTSHSSSFSIFSSTTQPTSYSPIQLFLHLLLSLLGKVSRLNYEFSRTILLKMLDATAATLKTNFFNEDRYALSLRVRTYIHFQKCKINSTYNVPIHSVTIVCIPSLR